MRIETVVLLLMGGCLLACCVSVARAQSEDGCVVSPHNESCVDYKMPSSMVEHGISTNCKAMYMVGCTVERICTSSDSRAVTTSPYCAEFSVLKDLCLDMPGMSGCRNYTSMCSNVSVVKECHTISLPLPKTMALSKTVEKMCDAMYMEPCAKCQKGMQCDLLQVYSDLCTSMWMDGCQDWTTLCQVIPDWPLCASGANGDMPMMKMYFHASIMDYVLFKEWVPRNGWQYALTIVAIVLLGMFYELLKVGRSIYEGYVSKKDVHEVIGHDHLQHMGSDESLVINGHHHSSVWEFIKGWDWKVELTRATMAFVETLVGLVLMLVAMTFNVGLFLAVCGGAFFGSLIFGRFANFSHMKHGCH